jgi:threonine/homoserine/homoserine lactone efflux protein
MSATILTLFIITSFIAIATPGPTVLLALSNGVTFGLRVAIYGMLGAMLSDLILIGAVAMGLGALLAASEIAFATVKWIGVVYLLYLGIQLLRTQPEAHATGPEASSSASPQRYRLFVKCLMVALTNPKGYLFFSAILPQFIAPQAPQLPQYLVLALTFAVIDGLVMLMYAGGGSRAAQLFRSAKLVCWINRLSGGALVMLAGALAFYRRAHN